MAAVPSRELARLAVSPEISRNGSGSRIRTIIAVVPPRELARLAVSPEISRNGSGSRIRTIIAVDFIQFRKLALARACYGRFPSPRRVTNTAKTVGTSLWGVAVAVFPVRGEVLLLLGFAGLWGVPYLVLTQELDRTAAAGVTSMAFIGLGVGAPVFGWLSDRIGRRKPPFVAGAASPWPALRSNQY